MPAAVAWVAPVGGLLAAANLGDGLKAIHHGHLDIHEDHVEMLDGERVDGQLAVGRHDDAVPCLLKHAPGHGLVDRVVFRYQDMGRAPGRLRTPVLAQGVPRDQLRSGISTVTVSLVEPT